MDIEKELEVLSKYMPLELLHARLDLAVDYCPEQVEFVIPSIVLSADGLTLNAMILVSDNYLCEVRFQGVGARTSFDYSLKNSICNYRIELWNQEIRDGELLKAAFDMATVTFLHNFPMTTAINYAGDKRGEWLKRAI